MTSKKTYRKRFKRQFNLLMDERQRNARLIQSLRESTESTRHWRAKYEEAVSSPEIKADTEAAFRRGAEHMKRSCASFLYDQIQKLETPSES